MKPLAACVVAAIVFAGCTKVNGPGATGGTRHPYTMPHVLRYATAEDIVGLNPDLVQQTVLAYMSSLTMGWLVKYDRHNNPAPELTTAVPTLQNGGISSDGLTITYHLRKNVKWSDGAPFNADDVVFSFRTVLNPATNVVSRTGFDLITKIDEPDPYTVVLHLKQKYASYAGTFLSSGGANPCVLPKHLLGKLSNINNAPYNALPVGIGPFKYAEWKRGDSVVLVRNPYYFRGQPLLERVVFKIVPDRNTVLAQLQSHEIDLWTPVASAYYDRVKHIPGIAVIRHPGYYFGHIDLQNTHPGLDDVRVRRALRLAINRQAIRQKIRHGLGIVQDNPVSPANPSFNKNVPTDPFDITRAAALLDQAGWHAGAGGVRTKGGHALNLTFATSVGTPDTDSMIELIRADWQRIGVTISVRRYPSPLFFAPYSNGGIVLGGKWDLVTFEWGGDPIGDLSTLYSCDDIPPSGQNDPRYCNHQVTAAMNAFNEEYDAQRRQKYADYIQTAIAKDVPIVVLDISEDLYAFNSDLKGFDPNQLSPFDDFMKVDI